MAEQAVKRRVLTKVRKQFLQKYPSEDDNDVLNYTSTLLATPEQLTTSTTCLLEPSIGLVETNRTIYAGVQFLNSHYKVNNITINQNLTSRAVTLDLRNNNTDILPWEYYVKRLESYGNLELAIWANRLKTYREAYPSIMNTYFGLMNPENSENSQMLEAMTLGKAQCDLACKELESKYAYCKVVVFANKDAIVPFSVTYNEKMLKDVGHSVDSFVEWTKEFGIPMLFKGDSILHMELSKMYLGTSSLGQSLFQEGPEYKLYLYDKEGGKKLVKVKLFYVMDLKPEGFYINLYITRQDEESKDEDNSKISEDKEDDDAEYKRVKTCVNDQHSTTEEDREEKSDLE